MFSGFMVNAWAAATIVAIVAGLVGFFTVLRGSAFAAHAIPNGSFAGAAGAGLIGAGTLLGLGVFAFAGAVLIALLGRRGRHDVATALTLVAMLGLGALFVSWSTQYAPQIYSLLFGEILGVSASQLIPTAALAAACVLAIALLHRPLLLASLLPDVARARGLDSFRMELAFLMVMALATTMTVPVVGTLLIFALMIGPAAAARVLTDRPLVALALSVAVALLTAWGAIAAAYATDYPVGFFVGAASAASYAGARAWSSWSTRGRRRAQATAAAASSSSPAASPGLDLV
jgi:zinc/manganese transport system permease protein